MLVASFETHVRNLYGINTKITQYLLSLEFFTVTKIPHCNWWFRSWSRCQSLSSRRGRLPCTCSFCQWARRWARRQMISATFPWLNTQRGNAHHVNLGKSALFLRGSWVSCRWVCFTWQMSSCDGNEKMWSKRVWRRHLSVWLSRGLVGVAFSPNIDVGATADVCSGPTAPEFQKAFIFQSFPSKIIVNALNSINLYTADTVFTVYCKYIYIYMCVCISIMVHTLT